MNRVKHGWGTLLDVLERAPNFAAESSVPHVTPELWSPEFTRCLHEIESIYDGSMDYAKGSHYFCDLRKVETEFFNHNILQQLSIHPRVIEMNSFVTFA